MKSGITRRWLTGSLLATVILLLLAESLFLYSYSQSYYGGVRQNMLQRFSTVSGQLQAYSGETVRETEAVRSLALRRMVEQFDAKERYEFMLLDYGGRVLASSSGTNARGILTDEYYFAAQQSADGVGMATYTTAAGERVMALCMRVPYAAEDVAALRLVTSLTLIDHQIAQAVLLSGGFCALFLLGVVASGLYFVHGIVTPLGQVETIAAAIAEGNLNVRLPVSGNQRDEVDRLRGTINRMAEGLAEAETMKNEFISSVSHELRTPLTSIKGWVETLEQIDDPTDENHRKGLAIISSETDRLYSMVEELLDFSRLQSGRLKIECEPLDLVAELTDAVLVFEARIRAEGLILSYEEPEQAIPVYADPDRLRQVFINILDNAIKYSAVGGHITIKVWPGKYKAFVEVLDQGRGIAAEDLGSVKTRFFKGKNAVRGSGIGLALVEEIMEAFDGTVDLKSSLGRGTVVTLGLPLYKPGKG